MDAVVEATFDLFRPGVEKDPSVRRIAERAGVGVGSIYEYFASREGVLDAVVDRFTEDNFARFEQRVQGGDAPSAETLCLAILDEAIDVYLSRPALTRSAIHGVLTNPLYYGALPWKGRLYDGAHEPLTTPPCAFCPF